MLGLRREPPRTVALSEALALLQLVEQVHGAAIAALGRLAAQSVRPPLQRPARIEPSHLCDDLTCAAHRRHQAAVEAVAALERARSISCGTGAAASAAALIRA